MRTKFGGCAGSFARFVATLFLCVLLVPCVPENGRADAAVTLAVTPFLAQGTSIQLGSAVSEAITSELVGHRDLVIVERSQFAALAKERTKTGGSSSKLAEPVADAPVTGRAPAWMAWTLWLAWLAGLQDSARPAMPSDFLAGFTFNRLHKEDILLRGEILPAFIS